MTTRDAHLAAGPDWRRPAVAPVLVLLTVAVLWNGAALAIDASPLEQGVDSWGYTFASVLLTAFYGSVAGVLTALTALAGSLGPRQWSRPMAWCGAVVAGLCGAGLVLAAVDLAVTEPPAGVVFGLVTFVLGLVLLVPLGLCVRRSRRA
jgi:hypothetical protein